MPKRVILFFLLCHALIYAQSTDTPKFSHFVTTEILYGIMDPPNVNFPNTAGQKGFFVNIGQFTTHFSEEWAYRLNYPKVGISMGVMEYGNNKYLGRSFTIMPFLEFNLLRNSNKLKVNTGLGGSIFNRQYDKVSNPNNKGITTCINWSYRFSLYYDFLKWGTTNLRFGLTYLHQSNGHTRLPNEGYNSYLLSLSVDIPYNVSKKGKFQVDTSKKVFSRSIQTFYSIVTGIGQNVLSLQYNDLKEVYSISLMAGRVLNKTYKFGVGFTYRFYEHYYDILHSVDRLILEQHSNLADNAFLNASSFGVFGSAELQLNHIGVEWQLGINLFKPTYEIDVQLNGYYNSRPTPDGYEEIRHLGEFKSLFQSKGIINNRLGLKYYILGTDKSPKHNIFLAASLNTNFGQADFSEISIGYIFSTELKSNN